MSDSIEVPPSDQYNQRLVENVHPPDWVNPKPAPRYNLVVIGAGTAGLVAAAGAAGLGAKVALIERHLMGGDCLNTGCVPSKALIRSAKAAHAIDLAHQFGINIDQQQTSVDFPQVMQRMRQLRSEISVHDSAHRFKELGVDVFIGDGKFINDRTIEVNNQRLNFKRAVIATGARAAVPEIEGLEATGYLTNETVFSLTELPQSLAVIGAGPIGCELAQTFARLGAQVTLLQAQEQILPREDPDASRILHSQLEAEGIKIILSARTQKVSQNGQEKQLFIQAGKESFDLNVDQILIATGRAPNVSGLGLDNAGVEYDTKTGVQVNNYLQTTNSSIYSAGDICSRFQFTHTADFQARLIIGNALFKGWSKASQLVIPWCTYTDPEIAHVGLYEHQAREQNIPVQSFVQELDAVDRAILDGETEGFVKIITRKGTDRILGATIVASHAGDLISEITVAMKAGLGLKKLASVIHPYPTQADAIRKIGDQYNRTRLSPTIKRLFNKWLEWTR